MSIKGPAILVVEDDPTQRALVADLLSAENYDVATAESLAEARQALEASQFDLVVSDWQLGDGNGGELLEYARSNLDVAFIMVTAYGTIERAVGAIQAGANDYLPKPFERQSLLLSVERTLRSRHLEAENRRLSEELQERDRLVDLVGKAGAMQKLYRKVDRLAGTEATVLIQGESGTGKELIARALHSLSTRAERPFIAINCAAIPEGLMEAEILGAEKGAYTGATHRRPGKFEAAHGGTLFLDEIGEMPLSVQPKLLRVLQEGTVTRIGGHAEVKVDVRVLAATNRDLEEEVDRGTFREDLFYRLNVVPVTAPPLRDRREDIPLLIRHFIGKFARVHGLPEHPFPARILRQLIDRPWRGNVRELANVVERLMLLADDGTPDESDLPTTRVADSQFVLPAEGVSWESVERSALEQALQHADGNKAQAARLLALPYKAFLYRLEKFNMS